MTWVMEILRIYPGRMVSGEILRDKAFNVAKNLKYNGYHL